jgi:hypothetical protein
LLEGALADRTNVIFGPYSLVGKSASVRPNDDDYLVTSTELVLDSISGATVEEVTFIDEGGDEAIPKPEVQVLAVQLPPGIDSVGIDRGNG